MKMNRWKSTITVDWEGGLQSNMYITTTSEARKTGFT